MTAAGREAGQPPLTGRQLRMYRGAFLVILFSESFVFLTLFALRFLLVGLDRPDLSPVLAGLSTLLFLAASVTAWLALSGIRSDDRGGTTFNLAVSFGLGILAFALVVVESAAAPGEGTRFGDILGATTWIHGAHIVIGLVFLAALWSSTRLGRFTPQNHWVLEAGVRFWWFVTGAWLALYVVFYWL